MIREQTKDLAAETGQATAEIAEGYKFARSAGLDLAESQKLVESATKASAAGFGEQRDLVRTATTAVNAWKEEIDSGSQFLDTLTKAAQNMDIEVDGLSSAFRRNINIASQLNLSLEETLSSLGAVAGAAGDASRGGRLFQQVLNGILSPTKQAEEKISELRGSVENFKDQIAEEGLVSSLVDLRNELERNGDGLEDVFSSSRKLEGALALTASEGDRAREILGKLDNTTGNVEKTFKQTNDTMREWNKTSQKFINLMIDLGTKSLPLINSVLEGTVNRVERFEDAIIGIQAIGSSRNDNLFSQVMGDPEAAERFNQAMSRTQKFLATGKGATSGIEMDFNVKEQKKLKRELARKIFEIDNKEVKRQFQNKVIPMVEAAIREGASSSKGVMQFLKFGPGGLREIRKQVEQANEEAQREAKRVARNADPIPLAGPVSKDRQGFNANQAMGRSRLDQALSNELDIAGMTFEIEAEADTDKLSQQFKDTARDVNQTFSSALARGIETGFEDSEDIVDSFKKDLARSLSRNAAQGITGAIAQGVSSYYNTGGQGQNANWVSAAINYIGNYGDTPGVQETQQGGMVEFAPGDKFAASKTTEGLQKQVNAEAGGGGGQVVVNQTINFPATPEGKIDERIRKAAPRITEKTKQAVMNDMQRGGGAASTARNA